MTEYNLKQYKESKLLLPHLYAILKVFTLASKGLEHFRAYIPAARVISTITEQKLIIEAHIKRYEKVKETKGKIS